MQQKFEKSSVLLFDPRGVVDENATPVAPRKSKLDGLRLGILDNSKWNAKQAFARYVIGTSGERQVRGRELLRKA